jgi:hypothetical protein
MTVFATLVVVLAAAQGAESWSDAEFAHRVLAVAKIGAPAAPALDKLRDLGLTCNPIEVRAIPGSTSPRSSAHDHFGCGVELQHLQGCVQRVELYLSGDTIASITLQFEEYPSNRTRAIAPLIGVDYSVPHGDEAAVVPPALGPCGR